MKILFILLFSFTLVLANIGKITAVKGDVSVKRTGTELKAFGGFILKKNDQVITKAKSKALILFNDNTSITVGKNSSLSVNEFIIDENTPEKSKTEYKFNNGLFRTITGKIGKLNPKGFKIKTKSASIGIRGTEFITLVTDEATQTIVKKGRIVLRTVAGIAVDVPEGQKSQAQQNVNRPSTPTTATQSDFQQMGAQEVNDNKDLGIEDTPTDKKQTASASDDSKKTIKEESTKKVVKNTPKQTIKENSTVESDNPDTLSFNESGTVEGDLKEANLNFKSLDVQNESVENPEEEAPVAVVEQIVEATTELPTEDEATKIAQEVQEEEKVAVNVLALSPTGEISTLLAQDLSSLAKDVVGNDTYMEFGYLLTDSVKTATYLTGDLTPNVLIESYIQSSQSASYSGNVAAFVDGTSSTGTINLNINYGQQTLTGNINVTEGNWQASINSGSVSPYGFSSTDISSADGSSVANITGNIDGKHYGPAAQHVGGTFKLQSGSNQVNGVFGGSK